MALIISVYDTMMNRAYTTLIIIYIILLTITPSHVQSECNNDASICWNCSDTGALSLATYKENLRHLLLSFPTATQNDFPGYYNMSRGKGPDDQVTVIGLCKGDPELNPELCKACLNNASTVVSEKCPSQKEAIIWSEDCMVKYSNDSKFHLMEEPLQVLPSPHSYLEYMDAATFNGRLKFLLQNLVGNASSNVGKYASGQIDMTKTREIYSLVQCIPSMSQSECSDCLNDSISKIPNTVDGARVLKPTCTLRFENGIFYNNPKLSADAPNPTAQVSPTTYHTSYGPSTETDGNKNSKDKIVVPVLSSVIGVVVLSMLVHGFP